MEESIFLETVGDTPILRTLDFLVTYEAFDYSLVSIARLSGVGYSTLKLFWPQLEKHGIVVLTRRVGKAKMYRLNDKSLAVQKFKEFYWTLTKERVHATLKSERKRQKVVVTTRR